MRCSRCGHANPADARFCEECGSEVATACRDCGRLMPLDAKYCAGCGSPVSAAPAPASYTPRHLSERILADRGSLEGERKQVTVLFCDIVQSSALAAELGPEEYHRAVDVFFAAALDEVHRYEGTINQFLGDGFMALFGAPVAHEDHARRAVHAARAVAERSDLDVRIGLNSGPVVVGAIGDDLRMDYTAFGDTTIAAARLQAAARPGDVLVSTGTAELVEGYFDLEPVAPIQVKERLLEPLRVAGLGPRTSRLHHESPLAPFVGRSGELAALVTAFGTAAAGTGQLVGIIGEPGIGKSRLALELRRAVESEAEVIACRCLSYGASIPYHPLSDLVAGEEIEIGLDDEPSVVKARTFAAVRRRLLMQAAERPLLLLVEDVHWIDRTSEEFLTELADDVPSAAMLVLATSRPGYAPPWLDRSFASQVALRPLADDACTEIVAWLLGAPDDAIVSRGEGNPFFLEELARAARDHVESIPQSVQDVLAARIDRLGPREKATLQVASVLGREFTLATVSAMTDDAAAADSLRELKRHEFISERHDAGSFVFKHALTREVAYEGLLESRRRELHRRAGETLERAQPDAVLESCEQLVHHFSLAGDSERTALYAELANDKATEQSAFEEALTHFYTAMAALDALPDTEENRRRRFALLFRQPNAFHWLFRLHELHELMVEHEPSVRELSDAEVLGSFHAVQSLVKTSLAEWDEVIAHGEEAHRLTSDPEVRSLAYTGQGWAYAFRGEHKRALECYRRALSAAHRGWHRPYVHGLAALSHIFDGDRDGALRIAEIAAAEGTRRADPSMVAFASVWASFACLEGGEWERAVERAQVGLEAAKTAPVRGSLAGLMSSALCHLGSAPQSLPVVEQVTELCRQANHRLAWSLIAWRLGDAYLTVGDVASAQATLGELLASSEERGSRYFAEGCRRLLGEAAAV